LYKSHYHLHWLSFVVGFYSKLQARILTSQVETCRFFNIFRTESNGWFILDREEIHVHSYPFALQMLTPK